MKLFHWIPVIATLPLTGASFNESIQPFLAKNCVACHNSKLKSGELDLQAHSTPDKVLKDREIWEQVVLKLRTGEMPPQGLLRPKPEEIRKITGWIESEFQRIDRAAKPDPGRVTARRLNRFEYNNTIRDLLHVSFRPADDFPADDSGYGFDNIGDVLSLSPVLMEKYLATADKISRRVIVAEVPQYRATRTQYKAEALGIGEYSKGVALQPGAIGPMPSTLSLHVKHQAPAQAEYEIKIAAGGARPADSPLVKLGLWIDGVLVKQAEVDPNRGKARNFEYRAILSAGEHRLSAALIGDDFVPENHPPLAARDRYFALDAIELRGPFNAVPPPIPESHKRLISCGHPLNQHEASCARNIISPLARRAFRRPVGDKELDRLLGFVALAQQEGESFEQGIRVALQAILVSPHFLFRMERDLKPLDASVEHPVSEFELASRLSYFLWSSMPDDELLQLAAENQLRQPQVLEAQVRRMMKDKRASALAENFAGQWLQLRNLDEAKPDPDRFPQFDASLRTAMKRETELFFEAVLKEDRSILDFLDGNYSFLNDRLAQHYGIAGVEGPQFRRVALTTDQRSGVLTHASVLTVSSYPTRTSPVIRGKWILENFLNAAPPPPPPGVPNLDEEAVGNAGSLRQQLEKHRSNSACASCHSRMDPLGFGLENYDAIGVWRTQDGKFPIDSTGTLPNGKSFSKPAELKMILKADRDEFAKALTEKLLTYSLGRGLERYDKSTVQSISRTLAAKQYRFSALVLAIVNSMPFQMRRGEGART